MITTTDATDASDAQLDIVRAALAEAGYPDTRVGRYDDDRVAYMESPNVPPDIIQYRAWWVAGLTVNCWTCFNEIGHVCDHPRVWV